MNCICLLQKSLMIPLTVGYPNFTLLDTIEDKAKFALSQVRKHNKEILSNGYTNETAFEKIMDDLQDINAYQNDHERILFKQQDEDYAILSLSGRWNSILMWSHYGDNHKGYCIGFSEEKIRSSRKFGWGGLVECNTNNNYPSITPYDLGMSKLIKTSHTKSKEWKYEKEYRLSDLLLTENPEIRKSRIRVVPNEFIVEINLGLMISEKDKQEILKWAIKKKLKVYQLLKVPFKYKLIRERVL
jgi:hypothetical protein